MRLCKECGARIEDDTLTRCGECGAELEPVAEEISEVLDNGDIKEEADETGEEIDGINEEGSESALDTGAVKTSEPEIQKASTKTTVVLIAAIVVLVGIIITLAVILIGKFMNDREKKGGETTSTPAATEQITAEPTSAENGNNSQQDEEGRKDYNVSVELGQYKGITVDYPKIEISEEEIQEELDDFVYNLTEDVQVDRPAQAGDILNIDYVGYIDGEEFEGGSDEGFDLELGSHTLIDAFENGLIGQGVGEHTLDIQFPDDYHNEDLAGKPVKFVVTVNSITERVTPELTDQLIADNSECGSIEEYKAYIKGYLEEYAQEDADEQVKQEILDIAVQNATFGGEIEDEINDMTQEYIDYYDQMASYYGVTLEDLCGMPVDDFKAIISEQCGNSAKLQHLLEKVAELENVEYTEEEYNEEFEYIFFEYYGLSDEAEVKEQLSDEEIEKMVSGSLKSKKAQDIIVENAVINK